MPGAAAIEFHFDPDWPEPVVGDRRVFMTPWKILMPLLLPLIVMWF